MKTSFLDNFFPGHRVGPVASASTEQDQVKASEKPDLSSANGSVEGAAVEAPQTSEGPAVAAE